MPTVPIPGLGPPGPPPFSGGFSPAPARGLHTSIGEPGAGAPREAPPAGDPGPSAAGDPGAPRALGLRCRPAAAADERGPVADARKLMARGQLTAASRTLASAGQGADVRAAAADLIGGPTPAGPPPPGKAQFSLPPEAEADYAATVEEAPRLMRSGKTGEAQAALERGLKKYAGAPGLLVLQCELLLRQGRPRAAGKPCSDALEVMEDLPQAHYLLGCVYAEIGQADRAITSLKRIELDRNDQKVWDALAQLYRGLGRTDEYSKFAAKHGM